MAHLKPESIPSDQLSEHDIAAIISIGKEQVQLMDKLEAALKASDDSRTLEVARELVGMERILRSLGDSRRSS
jgi:hypothetical protein